MAAFLQGLGDTPGQEMAPDEREFYSHAFYAVGNDTFAHAVNARSDAKIAYWDAIAHRGVDVTVPAGQLPTPERSALLARFLGSKLQYGDAAHGGHAMALTAQLIANPTPAVWREFLDHYDAFVYSLRILPAPFPTMKLISALAAVGLVGGGIYFWRKAR